MKAIILFLLVMFTSMAHAQSKDGYLLRCYNGGDVKDTSVSFLFSLFINCNDLDIHRTDSIQIDDSRHNFYFSEQLLRVFESRPYFIVEVPNKKFIENKSCSLGRPVILSNVNDSEALTYVLRIDPNYFYKIYIDKVHLSFCEMKRHTDFEFKFEKVIALKETPVFLKFPNQEKEKFSNIFSRIKL